MRKERVLWDDLFYNMQPGVYHKLTVGQPANTRFGLLTITGIIQYELRDTFVKFAELSGSYDVFGGVWVDTRHDSTCDLNPSDPETMIMLRVLRALLEEKLKPEEIVQAEKLDLGGYKLIHRYTGGWDWVQKPMEDDPEPEELCTVPEFPPAQD